MKFLRFQGMLEQIANAMIYNMLINCFSYNNEI